MVESTWIVWEDFGSSPMHDTFCVIIIISIYESMFCYDMMLELWWLAWNMIGWNGYALEW